MDFPEVISNARDSMTVKRVYGDPYERNGVTVIPAAEVVGGGGGGVGDQPDGGTGSGGGFGLRARPVGAYVIKGNDVRWESALDVNKVTMGALAVGALALLVARSIALSRD